MEEGFKIRILIIGVSEYCEKRHCLLYSLFIVKGSFETDVAMGVQRKMLKLSSSEHDY